MVRDAFQRQANVDAFDVKLKHEQDERKRAQMKLAEIMVGCITYLFCVAITRYTICMRICPTMQTCTRHLIHATENKDHVKTDSCS